jgi:Ser/Thr protein kinase RdoA (MazF antagonist)
MIILPNDDPFLIQLRQLLVGTYALPEPRKYTKITDGLINQTFDIDNVWILQHLNKIFKSEVNDDIAELTPILRQHGVNVPLICRTKSGATSVDGSEVGLDPGCWRLMTKVEGKTLHKVCNIEQIRSLTSAIAAFHKALDGCRYAFKHTRSGVHDFEKHQHALEQSLQTHTKHPYFESVQSLYEKMMHLVSFVAPDNVMACDDLRIIHGDPKVSNLLFENDEVVSIVDLDTMAKSRVAFDIGDAIRSWCNPRTESEDPEFNREYAREVLGLYLELSPFLTRAERESLPHAAALISLELAMRFARDALCEDYFAFDPEIGHAKHSFMRAHAMYTLCEQML